MAGKLVVGRNGQVKCPVCCQDCMYELWQCAFTGDNDSYDMLVINCETACRHVFNAEWFVEKDGSVEFIFHDLDDEE